jgi:hypothetical protein
VLKFLPKNILSKIRGKLKLKFCYANIIQCKNLSHNHIQVEAEVCYAFNAKSHQICISFCICLDVCCMYKCEVLYDESSPPQVCILFHHLKLCCFRCVFLTPSKRPQFQHYHILTPESPVIVQTSNFLSSRIVSCSPSLLIHLPHESYSLQENFSSTCLMNHILPSQEGRFS